LLIIFSTITQTTSCPHSINQTDLAPANETRIQRILKQMQSYQVCCDMRIEKFRPKTGHVMRAWTLRKKCLSLEDDIDSASPDL
jgi:hypothetical protein